MKANGGPEGDLHLGASPIEDRLDRCGGFAGTDVAVGLRKNIGHGGLPGSAGGRAALSGVK
ncbi:hypothetical protein D8770_24045 [Methylobacterium sp. DB1607]|nr:hypothetical protein [Methylobacterium sp. DB1607]